MFTFVYAMFTIVYMKALLILICFLSVACAQNSNPQTTPEIDGSSGVIPTSCSIPVQVVNSGFFNYDNVIDESLDSAAFSEPLALGESAEIIIDYGCMFNFRVLQFLNPMSSTWSFGRITVYSSETMYGPWIAQAVIDELNSAPEQPYNWFHYLTQPIRTQYVKYVFTNVSEDQVSFYISDIESSADYISGY